MWTLLLWLNQKVLEKYRLFKKRRAYRTSYDASRDLPDYLRRDMGLPPYDKSTNHLDR